MTARIYFISDGCGSIKIGISTDVARRVICLSSANPCSLTVLGEIFGDRTQERQIHNALADYRISGEWFRDCEAVRDLMASVLTQGLVASGFAASAQMVEGHFTVAEARQLADIIVRVSNVRVTEPGTTFGVPNTLLWRMRYRPGRRIFADEWHLLAEGAARAAAEATAAAQRDLELTQAMSRRRAETFVRAAQGFAKDLVGAELNDLPLWRAAGGE